MKKTNTWRKLLSMIMALIIVASLPMTAIAEVIDEGERTDPIDVVITIDPVESGVTEGKVNVETTAGKTEPVDVTVEAEVTTNGAEVNTQVTVKAEDYVTGSGLTVDFEASSDMTTNTETGITTGSAESHYTVENADRTYTAEGGAELKQEIVEAPETTLDVPMVEGETTEVKGDEAGTQKVTGDVPTGPNDGIYDYTTETVIQQGSVSVTTKEVEFTTGDIEYNVDAEGFLVKVLKDENGNPIGTEPVLDANGEKVASMEYVKNETTPIQGGEKDNELVYWSYQNSQERLQDILAAIEEDKIGPDENGNYRIETKDGYSYIYIGSDITSQYQVARLFSVPVDDAGAADMNMKEYMFDENGEERPCVIMKDENGNEVKYYLHRNSSTPGTSGGNRITFDSIYLDGQEYNRVPNGSDDGQRDAFVYVDENGVEHKWEISDSEEQVVGDIHLIYDVPQQFLLYDPATKQLITTYCADFKTSTEFGYNYNIENLEDATYYSDENAEHIRAIAAAGYWGVQPDVAEDGTVTNPKGSLDYMKEQLRASGQFTEEELALLTDGVALAATQMAIWNFSNEMEGIHFMNAHYGKNPTSGTTIAGDPGNLLNALKVTDTNGDGVINSKDLYSNGTDIQDYFGKDASVDLLFKLSNYLINLEPEKIEENTTANTIITAENFLTDMDVTVIKKAEDHANNKDQSNKNDAYVTELSFTLVVTPSTENGDDMLVQIITNNGETHTYRLAGVNKEGETYETLNHKNGVYTIGNLIMVEGDQTFNITLEGIQHLQEGVYLYTSEVVVDKDSNETSSQTLVGMASGNRAVSVSMSINFELNVEEEVIATERVWRTDPSTNPTTPPAPPQDPPVTWNRPPVTQLANEVVEIPEEPVPLAAPAVTGDSTGIWVGCFLAIAMSMLVINMYDSKRKGLWN